MASFDIVGTLKVKGDTTAVSDKFTKRDFVITTDTTTQYPQYISFQITQDKCALLDNFMVGEEMKVHFNLRGREWTSPQGEVKYFNSMEAWRLEKMNTGAQAAPSAVATPTPAADVMNNAEIADDLPF